jgi:hypothetical protein
MFGRDNILENVDQNQIKQLKKFAPYTDTRNEENVTCIFCDEISSKSKAREEWVKCSTCKEAGT